jgi:small subunit ribosomal protein S17
MTSEHPVSGRRVLTGRVVSDKMDKTVVVEVTRRVKHPKYGKYIKQTNRYKAHDEANTLKVNDIVEIQESRPLSRDKRWMVIERQA